MNELIEAPQILSTAIEQFVHVVDTGCASGDIKGAYTGRLHEGLRVLRTAAQRVVGLVHEYDQSVKDRFSASGLGPCGKHPMHCSYVNGRPSGICAWCKLEKEHSNLQHRISAALHEFTDRLGTFYDSPTYLDGDEDE